MFKHSKVALSLATFFALTGCLKVEDDGNKEISDQLNNQNATLNSLNESLNSLNESLNSQNESLNNQNDLLQSQIDLLTQQQENAKAPAAVTGTVVSASEGVSVTDAKVSVFVNNEWTEAVNVAEDGRFTVSKLPAGRDIAVKVYSESNAFLDRYFITRTKGYVANAVETTDLLELKVSAGFTKELHILDADNENPIEGLRVWALDYLNMVESEDNGNFIKFFTDKIISPAQYNAEKGVYEVTLPQDFGAIVFYDAGEDEDLIYYSNANIEDDPANRRLLAMPFELEQTDRVYLEAQEAMHEFDVAITMLDENGEHMQVKRMSTFGFHSGDRYATYNEQTQQYELKAKFSSNLTIQIPSFRDDETVFNSGYIRITPNTGKSSYNVEAKSPTSDYHYNRDLELSNNTLHIVSGLESTKIEDTTISIITEVSPKTTIDNDIQLYLNLPVQISRDDIQLVSVDHAIESKDGISKIVEVATPIDYDLKVDLDNTRFSFTPKGEVNPNHEYRLIISQATNLITNEIEKVDIARAYELTPENVEFDINELLIDNINHTTNGELIVGKNSAGTPTDHWYYDRNAHLIMPKHLHLVQNLSYEVIKYSSGGQENIVSDPEIQHVIEDENHYTQKHFFAKLAENEQFGGGIHFRRGASIPDGYYSYIHVIPSLNLGDNTNDSKNSITIRYSYQLKQSEQINTGTLELPVK